MSAGGAARFSLAAAAAAAALAGCGGDAVLITVDGDLPVAGGVDAICLAIADRDPAGGHFGRAYPLDDLPASLRVEPGAATDADAWVVGYRAGVPVARDAAAVDFGGDVTLRLDACARGAAGTPAVQGAAAGPPDAVIAPVHGRGGARIVAVAAGMAVVVDVDAAGALVTVPAPGSAVAAPPGIVAFDADGDCDDDVVVVRATSAPILWQLEGPTATAGDLIGATAVRAAAAADVDRDTDIDVVTATGSTLVLYRNDGAGRFTADPAALTGTGFVTDVTALAFGDLDGDGSVDLVAGQNAAPLRAFLGDPGGAGFFAGAPAVLPDLAVTVRALRLADADGDHDPDLWVSVVGGPARLYVDREGRLENQSFVRLPQPAPEAAAIAVGGWDDDCAADAAVAGAAGGTLWHGDGTGTQAADGTAPASSGAELVDLDDDGDLDLVLSTPQGVTWLAR